MPRNTYEWTQGFVLVQESPWKSLQYSISQVFMEWLDGRSESDATWARIHETS